MRDNRPRKANRKKNARRRVLYHAVTVCCCAVLIVGLVCVVNELLQRHRVNQTSRQLRETFYAAQTGVSAENPPAASGPAGASAETQPASGPTPVPRAEAEFPDMELAPEAVPLPAIQPQFEALRAENPDVIGWLKVADIVDHPLLWRDNDFYMNHDFYGADSKAGAIFLDYRNQAGFEPNPWLLARMAEAGEPAPEPSLAIDPLPDDQLLIYGHNMKSGSMFGDMDNYRKLGFLKQHPTFTVQAAWEAEPREYVIFSLFDASMNSEDPTYIKITEFAFAAPADKQAYIDALIERSDFKAPVEVTAEDQLVMLVTCSYSQDNGRYLVTGRRLREGETAEQIAARFAEMN